MEKGNCMKTKQRTPASCVQIGLDALRLVEINYPGCSTPRAIRLTRMHSGSCEVLPVQPFKFCLNFIFYSPSFIMVSTEPHHLRLTMYVHQSCSTRYFFRPGSTHVALAETFYSDINPQEFYTRKFILAIRPISATRLNQLRLHLST